MGKHSKGYTLVEMVVVMAIFTIIMVITSKAFDSLISTGSQQSKSAMGQIEGIVGLEMLRRDLSHAGYAIPWSFQNGGGSLTYSENTTLPVSGDAVSGITAAALKDDPPTAPRALKVRTATTDGSYPGSDYMVIKSALLALPMANSSVGRWGLLDIDSGFINAVGHIDSNLRVGTDRVITLVSSFNSSTRIQDKQLMVSDTVPTDFSYRMRAGSMEADDHFKPSDPAPSYLVYALSNSDSEAPKMPYNRADYYVSRPADSDTVKIPASCNAGTGILFKSVVRQTAADGFERYPLLNCVGDMKVILQMVGASGAVGPVPASSPAVIDPELSAAQLRESLKSATVYVLAHEGGRDRFYSYPSIDATNALFVGPSLGVGNTWTQAQMAAKFGADWKNYRWKVYEIPVSLKNLQD